MKKIRLLIADTDQSYLNALVKYLIGTGNQYEVTGYTDVARFLGEENDFALALLTGEFIDGLRRQPQRKRQFDRILYLSDSQSEGESEYERIYKFQNMSTFIEQMRKAVNARPEGEGREIRENATQHLRIIFSPMHHELSLPFSLSMAKIIGESQQTLLVDMEDISILGRLLERELTRDLGDYLYHIAGLDSPDGNMTDFLGFYENFYYLAPMKGLSALAAVTPDQWIALIDNIRRSEFDQVIMLMDSSVNGMDEILHAADDILLLGKPGEYYAHSMREFTRRLSVEGLMEKCSQMLLPMSAQAGAGSIPQASAMMNGNLGSFVRREFTNGAAL